MRGAPQELVDHILSFAYDDLHTLYSARLVCRAWNIAARVYTLRSLDLQINERELAGEGAESFINDKACTYPGDVSPTNAGQMLANTDLPPSSTSSSHKSGRNEHLLTRPTFTRLHTLCNILKSSPDMAHCVREVIVGNTIHLEQPEQWKVYAEILIPIFSHLRRVSSLFLQHIYLPSPAFAHFLLGALQSDVELQRLELWDCWMPNIDDLILLLNHFPAVTNLRLSGVRFKEFQGYNHNGIPLNTYQDASRNLKRILRKPLQKLSVDALPLSPFLCALTSHACQVDLTKLRSLTLSYVNDIANLRRFLQVAGSHLEHLQISGSCYSNKCVDSYAMFNLSHTPCLKSLRIFGPTWMASFCPSENLQHIFNLLPTNSQLQPTSMTPSHSPLHPPSPTPLKSLHIGIAAFKRTGEEYDYTKWSILDDVLSRPAYACLTRVNIVIDVTLTGPRGVDATKVVASFPRLQTAKKIRVVCS